MANPRHKFSKSRTRKRRSVYYRSLQQPTLMECPSCGGSMRLHHACPACGEYRGRKIVNREQD